jgi:hypothetical protein
VAEVQGIVYVYLGDDPGDAAPPRVAELDEPGWIYEQDYMRDLPCAACSHPQAHDSSTNASISSSTNSSSASAASSSSTA